MRNALKSGLLTALCAGSMLVGGCGKREERGGVFDGDKPEEVATSVFPGVFVNENRTNIVPIWVPTAISEKLLEPKIFIQGFPNKIIFLLEREGENIRNLLIFDDCKDGKREIRAESAKLVGDDLKLSLVLDNARIATTNRSMLADRLQYDLYDFGGYSGPLNVSRKSGLEILGHGVEFESVCFFNYKESDNLRILASVGISGFKDSPLEFNLAGSSAYLVSSHPLNSLKKICSGNKRIDVRPIDNRELKEVMKLGNKNGDWDGVFNKRMVTAYKMDFDPKRKPYIPGSAGVVSYFSYDRNPEHDDAILVVGLVGDFNFSDSASGKTQRVLTRSLYSDVYIRK